VNARLVAGGLALAALVVHFGLAVRYREQASAAADAFRRLRDERHKVSGRLAQEQRLEDAQRRAGRLTTTEGSPTPTRAARLQVLRSLEGSGVTQVRLGVSPAGRPLSVNVRLSGEGSYDEVVKLSGDVARAGTGLLLQQVALENREDRVILSLEAVGLEAR
jgi:hypothetical protein